MGERSLQQRNKNEKIKIMPGKRKKKKEDSMFGRKKKNKQTGLYRKESASQETDNLLRENPVADREKDTVVMKKGHRAGIMRHMKGFAKYDHGYKKTDARIARDYAANAAFDAEHGYKSEANYEAKEAEKAMAAKKGGMFGNKTSSRTGLVKGTKRNARRRSRG